MGQKFTVQRTNGNVPKSLTGEDHITGLIVYVSTLPEGFADEPIQAVSTIDRAEALGITSDAAAWEIRVLHYHLSEIFRLNPAISLYVGLFTKPTGAYTFSELKTIQNYAAGRLRQVGIYAASNALAADDLTTLEGVADTLESEDVPLSVIYAPKITNVVSLPTDLAGGNKNRVSVLIGQAGSGVGATLFTDEQNTAKDTVGSIGVALGILSGCPVHESIAWIKKYPTGIDLPAFGDGTLLRDLDRATIETLDETGRYLFFVTYCGLSGSYFNDNHTMDAPTSDYAYINTVRTMDKAVRGIRTYLLPELGGTLYIDADTGKLQAYTVEHLTTVANKQLEDMEKAGELSGFLAEVDPEQNVLATSSVEIVVKQVEVGVMRKINLKIGYAASI